MYETPSRPNSRTSFKQFNAPQPLTMPPMPPPTPGGRFSHSPVRGPTSPSTPTLPLPQTPQNRQGLRKHASMQTLSSARSSRIGLTPRAHNNEVYKGRIHVGVRSKPSPMTHAVVLDSEENTIDHETAGLFKFDRVYTQESTNATVFNDSVEPLIQQVCNGFNGTVFAYGTTGSGKTYTMQGLHEDPGVITRSVDTLFSLLEGRHAQVKLSYFEIYNERVYDLLTLEAQPNEVFLRDTSTGDTQVVGQREVEANSADELLDYIAFGDQLRRTSSTQYNEHSSRSHAVVRIQVIANDNVSILYLCDLAGSEKATVHSERRREGSYINKSLLTLSSVISLLSKGGGQHVPYRDSKLTRLLQPSLSGSALVSMICTIHTTQGSAETVNSLRFAAKAKDIIVTAKKASVFDELAGGSSALSGLAKLVEQLQAENSRLMSDVEKIRIERDDLRDRLEVYELADNTNADASLEILAGISESEVSLDGMDAKDSRPLPSRSMERVTGERDFYKKQNHELQERITHLVTQLGAIDASVQQLESSYEEKSRPTSSLSAVTLSDKDEEIAELREQLKDKELVISCMTTITDAQKRAKAWSVDDTLTTVQQVEELRI